ncbi:MAG: glycosyltransferase [Lachnospiraceae bacterium]|nr:glycosyltransferase [Lachnospiraceae bacterium]
MNELNTKPNKPLVSILVPCYNNQHMLYDLLDSIMEQDYPCLELIIGDDGSKDFKEDDIRKYLNNDIDQNIRNLVILKSKENKGTVFNIEKMQQKCSGEFLFNIAADDVFGNSYTISSLEKYMENNPEIDVAFSQTEMWDSDLVSKQSDFVSEAGIEIINNSSPEELFSKCACGMILPACYMYRRQLLSDIGMLSKTYKLVEDIPTHFRLLRKKKRFCFPNEGAYIKHRSGGISHGNSRGTNTKIKNYYQDLSKLYPVEVLPFISIIPITQRMDVIKRSISLTVKTRIMGNPGLYSMISGIRKKRE